MPHAPHRPHASPRDRRIQRLLMIEGLVNLVVVLVKALVGSSTGSFAILGDAIHSLTDLTNNIVALVVIRLAGTLPDREHSYGHRKFETLVVFGSASLLTVLAFELGLRSKARSAEPVARQGWALVLMLLVLGVNIGIPLWQRYWAMRLNSDILRADAHHTLADVLTTVVVIVGWQGAARGYPWLDSVFALGVAALVLCLAYGLFKRATPVLVDRICEGDHRGCERIAHGCDSARRSSMT